jgi:hypothetical protein
MPKKLHVSTARIELHYLPCIAYFSALSRFEEVVVEKFEHYQKQSFRNRCYLRGPHRVEALIVPVTGKGSGAAITDIKIDYSQKWLNNHWRTIRTAYGKAPFFEYYAPDLEGALFAKHAFLYDLNLDIMTLCLKWLKMELAVSESTAYDKEITGGAVDLRRVINPKKEDGCNRFYKRIEYHQVFGSKFVPNLSLIDLVFSQGPAAAEIVKASALK